MDVTLWNIVLTGALSLFSPLIGTQIDDIFCAATQV